MTYKDFLVEKGFIYSEKNDEWRKPLGFGMNMSCVRLLGTLFEIKKGKKVLFSHFIDNLEHFKQVINKSIDYGSA